MVSKNNHQVYQQKLAERKQRWGIRKLSVGVASVLLGTTFMLYSNHAVLADTVPTNNTVKANSTDPQGSEGTAADAEEKVENPTQGQNPTQDKGKQNDTVKANSTDPQGSQTAADAEEKVENPTQGQNPTQNPTNVDKKDTDTGNVADLQDSLRTTAEEKGVATNHQGTPQGQDTTQNTTNEKGITPNVWAARLLAALVVNPTSTDPKEASTSLPMSNQDIKLDSQPMLTEITNKPKDNWVYNNLKHYWDTSTATVKRILETHTTDDERGRYYFAGAANYNESYHAIYLLARSNNLNDNNLYVTILHTGWYQNIQEKVVAPGESKKVEYSNGTGGTTHTPIFTNYDGTSVSIGLDGVEKGDNNYGMVVGFAYGYDTGKSGDSASMGNGFMTTPMPTKVTTTIHYVDQATGDELAVPKSFEGVAYQKYTITGEAPTIDGYTLKKSPKTTGYISPYKVGESYDFRLDKHVVVKQTVIDSQGLVRVTAYYDGEAIGNTTRYLGNILNDNDHYSFFAPNGKSYTYINQITSTNDGIVYYYAKDGSEDKSEVRVHYIDVTGNKNSLFVPGDGKEVATDKISGKLGETYNYNVNVPTDYNLATNQKNTVKGTYTIDHHDEYVYVVKKTSAEKTKPKVPSTKEPVANTSSLTETEKANVHKNVEDANKGNFPADTKVTVGDDGTATVTYPDKTTDTIEGSKLVRPATDAEKTTPNVPATKEPVANTSSLTDGEKAKVQKNVEDANKGNFPADTKVTVGDDGTATINYPDTTTDTIKGSDLVRPATDAEKTTPKVPSTKEPVANTSSLTETEKAKVQQNVEDANKDENGKSTFPEGTTVTVGDDGTATINYPDTTTDTIEGSKLVRPATDAEKTTPKVPSTKEPVANTSNLTETEKAKVQQNVEDANKDENGKSTFPEGTTVTVGDDGTATINYPDTTTDTIKGSDLVRPATDADNYNPEVVEITVNRNTKLGPTEAKEAIKNAQSLPEGTTYSWAGEKLPDTSTPGQKNGWVVVTYPDTSRDIVSVNINVKADAESYTVTPKDKVSVDKGEDVDPASLVTVTDPDGKQVQLPAGSIDWKDGAKPDLTTQGDKTGSVEVTFLDGSKKDTDVTIHVKTDAETYDPQAQPWTTTVGKTPKADEVISSTDKNGKKMPSDANYTWKTEPNTSKIGEASGEVTVTYADGSHDDVPVTINVKDKLNDNEKYHIYGKDGLKVDKGQTLDPKDAIDVKDADGKETTLPEGSTVGWTKKPDFSQAGKDVTGEVTVTYPGPDGSKSDPVTVTVHVNGKSDEYKVAPRDGVTVQRGGQVDPEKTVVAQTPDGKPTSFPDGTKHEWITKPDTDSTGKRTGVVKTTFQDGSTTTTTVSVTVEPNQSDEYDPKGPENPDDRVPVKDPEHLTDGDKNNVKGEVGKVNPDLPKGTEVTVDDKGNATIKYPDGSKDTIKGGDLVRQSTDADKTTPSVPETDAEKITPNVPGTPEPVANTSSLTETEKAKVQKNVEDANKGNFPDGTKVDVGDDGTATVNYPDGSKDTIPGDQLVQGQKGSTTDAGNITPTVPGGKVTVKDPSHLTDDEKKQVQNNVDNANKDKFPAGTTVEVGKDGTATVTYPDGSKDTIPGDQLVQGQKGDTTDAGNITPTVPGGKVTVKDPSHLTDDEKNQVKNNVDNANKDKFPAGTDVTVGDDGTATVNYPDGSKDTIPGDQLVQGQKGDTTDAGNITPTVPGDKVTVKDPSHLTDDEKKQVKNNVDNAN
ncbi:hypothetical protein A3Q24_05240, partial [Lactobacillus johnsonii]